MVYVDTAPREWRPRSDFNHVERSRVWAEVEEVENLDGVSVAG